MKDGLTSLRELFLDPPNAYRHLAIIHGFVAREKIVWDFDTESPVKVRSTGYKDTIKPRLERIASWGFGGVVANVVGHHYLEDDEDWRVFTAGVQAAKELGMRLWIYDEQGYPSGAAGGIVLRDHPEYEAQNLVRMRESFEGGEVQMRPPTGWLYAVRAEALHEGQEIAEDVTSRIGDDGYLRLPTPSRCTVTRFDARRAYEGTHATRNVFRLRRYINVLRREAVDYFLEVTGERYLRRLGEDARAVEAVFTDEPSFMSAYFPEIPEWWRRGVMVQDEPEESFDAVPMIAWDDSMPRRFRERWGCDLLPELNRLFEGDSPRDLRVRHDFYQLQSEVYADTYFGTQQARFSKDGIEFSGHVLAEESIVHHVACEANVLADLKQMGIPGIDMLNSVGEEIMDSPRLLTCKYGSSAAHLAGREQVMSEVSEFEQRSLGRETTLAERRGAVAVQMALGVTTLTSYYPWHETDPDERRRTLDFWARLAPVVRCGTHIADFAVLYPIRAAWAAYKPVDQVLRPELVDEPLRSMDAHLLRIARAILGAGLDFDFIDTRDLISAAVSGGRLGVANESYPALVIPPGAAMCPKDLERTEAFVEAGGRVIAFEPCSEFSLGRPPAEVIAKLAEAAPDRVLRASLDGDWVGFAAERDVTVELGGEYLVARRSVCGNTDVVLVANGSHDDARAGVDFGAGRSLELWDPWEGVTERVDSNAVDLTVPGYSAMVVVSERSEP